MPGGQQMGRPRSPAGHYEFRDHPSISGLVEVHWINPGQPHGVLMTLDPDAPEGQVVNIGANAVGLLVEAATKYLAEKRGRAS